MPASPKLQLVREPSPEAPDRRLTLDEAFRAHAPYVARVALRTLGRPEEVDDLVQHTFLEAMSGLKGLRSADALRAWLATIVVRLARRKLRLRKWRRWARLDDAPEYLEVADSRCSPDDRLMMARIYTVLDGLPVEQRLAWTLRHVEGERLEHIAAVCECSLATVKRRVASAQAALEKVIHGP